MSNDSPCSAQEFEFRRLQPGEVMAAEDLLRQVAGEIRKAGRRQRVAETTREMLEQWQREQALWGVLDRRELLGVVAMRRETLLNWPDWVHLGPQWMVRGLATAPAHRGKSVGRFAMQRLLNRWVSEPVYLDCVSQFLPEFYAGLGFRELARREQMFSDGRPIEIVLMKWP